MVQSDIVQSEKIRLLRVVKNESQTELATRANISQPVYTKLETGIAPLLEHHYKKLAEAHEVCPKWLAENEPFSILLQVDAKGNLAIIINPVLSEQKPDLVDRLEELIEDLLKFKTAQDKKPPERRRKKVRQSSKPRKRFQTSRA